MFRRNQEKRRLSARSLAVFLLVSVSTGCGAKPEATTPSPDVPAKTQSLLVEEGLSLVEEMGRLAEAHAASCEEFTGALERLLRSEADIVERMRRERRPAPTLSSEQVARGKRAMAHVSPLVAKCSGNPAFDAAIGKVFVKQRDPVQPTSPGSQSP